MLDRSRVKELLCGGERLASTVERTILDHEHSVVPTLVEILLDEGLASEDSPGDGYAPIHAARLLGELRAEAGVESMLRRLQETDWNDILHNALQFALPKLGAAVVEPALRSHAETTNSDFKTSLAAVLAECGVRDERIYGLLIAMIPNQPDDAAGCLQRYGDRRAVEPLSRAFNAFRLDRGRNPLANQTLIELRDAIEKLGGALTTEQEAKYTVAMEPRDRWRAQIDARLGNATRPERPGRNEPCWCGSTKKYKRCHLEADEQEATSAQSRMSR